MQPLPAHFQISRHPHLAHQVYQLAPPTFQYPPHAAHSQPAYTSISQVISQVTNHILAVVKTYKCMFEHYEDREDVFGLTLTQPIA